MENQQDNKALWIFKNFKDTIDVLPKKYRGRAWELVINYAFDGEIDLSKENSLIQMAVKSLIPLIKLRGKGGSQNGISNNPSGKNKANVGANVGANIGANVGLFLNNNNSNNNKKYITETKTETEKEETAEQILKNWYGEYRNVYLDENDYNKALSICLDEKYLNELIEAVGEAIEKGKYNVYDETRPHAHLALVKAFHKHRMQNPSKYRQPQSQEDEIERLKRMHEEMMRKEKEEEREANEQF